MEMIVDFYEKEKERDLEEESEENPSTLILDVSKITPGKIEIEDEIRMTYLWEKYGGKK